jgi:hypothetical protein
VEGDVQFVPHCYISVGAIRIARALSGLCAVVVLGSCVRVWNPTVAAPTSAALAQPAPNTSSIKLHLRSGELIIATAWQEDTAAKVLRVVGTAYHVDRLSSAAVERAVPLDSIALLQASTAGTVYPSGLVTLAIWGTISGVVSGACLVDPKACFGSCPTFYVGSDSSAIQSEGFSASPLRTLEARDVDHLYSSASPPGPFVVRMRNEALETHAVRSVRLLIAPRPTKGRVFHSTSDELFPATGMTPPSDCRTSTGDCTSELATLDSREWKSTTDSTDLATRETVELTFDRAALARIGGRDAGEGQLGLILGARHTLVSTFLFYQSLAFAGDAAGDALARIERGTVADQPPLFAALRTLGTIDVSVSMDGARWTDAGRLFEAGPLATDPQVIPLAVEPGADSVHIRLSLTRGYWRLDYAALARLGRRIEPIILSPVSVTAEGRTVAGASAAAALADTSRVLVTGPGDTYALAFELPATLPPASDRWEVFLESTGWYYEWMREEWRAEQDAGRAAQLLYAPRDAFRALAPMYKSREATNERAFWMSRIRRTQP